MAKFKLDTDPDPEVMIIGISSHVHELRLCWALNRSLGLSLTRRRTDITDITGDHTAHFATFDHRDDDPASGALTLIHNHSSGGVLLKEHRQADFFLVVDQDHAARMPGLLDRVRDTDLVLAAFPLDLHQMRAGHKLLDWTI